MASYMVYLSYRAPSETESEISIPIVNTPPPPPPLLLPLLPFLRTYVHNHMRILNCLYLVLADPLIHINSPVILDHPFTMGWQLLSAE